MKKLLPKGLLLKVAKLAASLRAPAGGGRVVRALDQIAFPMAGNDVLIERRYDSRSE